MPPIPPRPATTGRWSAFTAAVMRGYHAYGSWLVSISWKRFLLLSLLLLIATGILQNIPPFSLKWQTWEPVPEKRKTPAAKIEHARPSDPAASAAQGEVEIRIGEGGIRIRRSAPPAASPASGAASAPPPLLDIGREGIEIKVPSGADNAEVREAVREARDQIREAIEEARAAAEEAAAEAKELNDTTVRIGPAMRVRHTSLGEALPEMAFLWIAMSMILKITYKGRLQAEVKAARATETAESESLKRQVVEARMAAMQAQVEPHFLFNTLASIDHLIETDPKRASVMQKNLIALLRASMPTMRETAANGVRDLGREMAVITPYLEILKVRMEDRLATQIDVPDGLRSAEFPPMMIQSLVENAIKHGLEPKPEGGTLTVKAEIVHGSLAVTVADTGLGFGKAATAGTGIGLNNIRERLQLLYGHKATLTVAENQPSGTRVTITVPYVAQARDDATMPA
ncbi:sensor histidine kinase [uncultured Piscinibacter sp.]|uniref:sensor histidine kinase n=1 Tax=uncultured Piscinibacter sp. TaxID=1131835 RepID=UPI0026144E02|nr:histidine kinase [uncultured Piscinibacter sp.]